MQMRMYGSSDDLIEVENVTTAVDEVEVDGEPVGNVMYKRDAEFAVNFTSAKSKAVFILNDLLRIEAYYEGSWLFGVGYPLGCDDGDFEFPTWFIRIGCNPHNDYSPLLAIDLPEEVEAHLRRIG